MTEELILVADANVIPLTKSPSGQWDLYATQSLWPAPGYGYYGAAHSVSRTARFVSAAAF